MNKFKRNLAEQLRQKAKRLACFVEFKAKQVISSVFTIKHSANRFLLLSLAKEEIFFAMSFPFIGNMFMTTIICILHITFY